MSDLLWNDVRTLLDPELVGVLPDVTVADASAGDWRAVVDLVVASGWHYEYLLDDEVMPLPRVEEVLSRPAEAEELATLQVWPADGVQATFYLLSADSIDFDVDVRELQGQAGLDVLCDFLRAIGLKLGKAVVMTAEGADGIPLLGFEVESGRVVALADAPLG